MFGITSKKMEKFRDYLAKSELKDRSRNNYIKHLRKAIKKAMKWGYIQGNPLGDGELKQFKVDEQKVDFLTREEVSRLLNVADKYSDMRTAIALQVFTGMSRAEVVSAMTFEDNRIIYKRVKTGSLISVPIAKALRPYINHLQGIRRVITWKNPRTYSKHFEMVVKEAGLQGITPHKLRHTFASELLNEGVDIQTISELLGHKDSSITAKFYLHIRDEKKKKAVDLLDYGM